MKKFLLVGIISFFTVHGVVATVNDISYNYGHKSVDTVAYYDTMNTERDLKIALGVE